MEKYTLKIMADLRPSYYDDFHCLAERCRISCCVGWEVTFNKKDYLGLKQQKGTEELDRRLAHGIRRIRKESPTGHYAEFDLLEGGVCPLLRDDHLCALQVEKGHGALPEVCQKFPRAERYLPSGYLERSLVPACEGVLELLWQMPDGIDFRSGPLPQKQCASLTFQNAQSREIHFQDIRGWCIDTLQDRRYPLPERILRMGIGLRELADGGGSIGQWMKDVHALLDNEKDVYLGEAERQRVLPMFLSNNRNLLRHLRSRDPDFPDLQTEVWNAFCVKPEGELPPGMSAAQLVWLVACGRYEKQFGDREYFMENLMVAVFYHLHFPKLEPREALWKSFVNFCNIYSFYRYMMVMSCREGSPGGREELFRAVVHVSRCLLHNSARQEELRDEFFANDSATLAHMAILLSG